MAVKKTNTQPTGAAGAAETVAAEQSPTEGAKAVKTAQSASTKVPEYKVFVYVGPSLPGGVLKANSVLQGTRAEIVKHFSAAIKKYPQVEKLLFPVGKLGEVAAKVKTPGNVLNKYYKDIVSAMHNSKEE